MKADVFYVDVGPGMTEDDARDILKNYVESLGYDFEKDGVYSVVEVDCPEEQETVTEPEVPVVSDELTTEELKTLKDFFDSLGINTEVKNGVVEEVPEVPETPVIQAVTETIVPSDNPSYSLEYEVDGEAYFVKLPNSVTNAEEAKEHLRAIFKTAEVYVKVRT